MIAKIGRALLFLLLLVIVVAGVAFGVLQTRFAKDKIAALAEGALTNEHQSARIEGIGGLLPFDIRVATFELSDKQGVWLEVEDAHVELSPTRLVSRELLVDRITAARLAVHRQPDLPPAPEPEPASDDTFALPEIPDIPESLPVALAAEKIAIERIELGEPLFGSAMELALDGGVATSPERDRLDLRLDLDRTDEETLSAAVRLGLDLATREVGVDVKVDETGGLVAKVADMPEAGPLHLRLEGNGPLTGWRANLELAVEGVVKGGADLGLVYSATPSIDLVAEIVPAEGTVPAEILDVIGERLDLALEASHPAPRKLELSKLLLKSRALQVDGSGVASLEGNLVDGSVTARIEDLDRLSGIAGTELGGAFDLRVDATGTFADPKLELNLDGNALSGADFFVRSCRAVSMWRCFRRSMPVFPASMSRVGSVDGLMQGGEPLRPENALTLAVKAHVPLEGQARIEQLDLVGAHVDLATTAEIAMPSLAGTAKVEGHVESLEELIAALGPMAPPDLALSGSLTLDADAVIGEEAREVDADIRLSTAGLRGLPQGADDLVGDAPGLSAKVAFVQGEQVRVSDLKLDVATVTASGDVALGLDAAQALNGRIDLDIPALSAFNEIAKQALAGRANAGITLAGSATAPEVAAKVRVEDFEAAGQGFDEIRLDATAAGPTDRLAGRVRLEAEQFARTLGSRQTTPSRPKPWRSTASRSKGRRPIFAARSRSTSPRHSHPASLPARSAISRRSNPGTSRRSKAPSISMSHSRPRVGDRM
ncbi:MAG: hypothetical protein R3C97_09115 [Geminicoccaceae bacterium]